jgi:hypothetical protein
MTRSRTIFSGAVFDTNKVWLSLLAVREGRARTPFSTLGIDTPEYNSEGSDADLVIIVM